jgi:hypothetical protein
MYNNFCIADFEDKDIFERVKLTMFPEIMTFRKFKVPMDILNLSLEEYNQMNQKLMFQIKIVA